MIRKIMCGLLVYVGMSMADGGAGNATIAIQHILNGQKYLNDLYDYNSAITEFKKADETAEHTPDEATVRPQAWVGLAMCYHNIGQQELRNALLEKAQKHLQIPDNPEDYPFANGTEVIASYFTVNGFKLYVGYEQCRDAQGTIDEQEQYLKKALVSFVKAIEIAQHVGAKMVATHATHGAGTMLEFLSKCEELLGNPFLTESYSLLSVEAFEEALQKRTELLGDSHLNVARSHHKLARNYARLASLLDPKEREKRKSYHSLAENHYKKALAIFRAQGIPREHPKRKELEDEYQQFLPAFLSTLGGLDPIQLPGLS